MWADNVGDVSRYHVLISSARISKAVSFSSRVAVPPHTRLARVPSARRTRCSSCRSQTNALLCILSSLCFNPRLSTISIFTFARVIANSNAHVELTVLETGIDYVRLPIFKIPRFLLAMGAITGTLFCQYWKTDLLNCKFFRLSRQTAYALIKLSSRWRRTDSRKSQNHPLGKNQERPKAVNRAKDFEL
jgi:hypothetical protein